MHTHLILGGTGKVGRRVIRQLSDAGHDVRAVSRSTPIPFDWRDEASWPAVLEGAATVFIVGPGSATDWSAPLSRFLEAAAQAGVGRAVLLSARGVEFLPGGAVDTAEQALRTGPVPWTVLRPTHFAQNFTEAMFVPVDGRIVAPAGDGAEPFIDVDDIAAVAARVLSTGGFERRVLELSGPVAVTFAEAAQLLSQATGAPVSYVAEGEDAHIERLRALATPEGYIRWRMAMLRGIASGADAYVSDGVAQVLGRPGRSFHDWAETDAAVSLGRSGAHLI